MCGTAPATAAISLQPGEDVARRTPAHLLGGEARDRLRRGVPDADRAARVDEEHRVGDRVERRRRLGAVLGLVEEPRVVDRDGGARGELLGEAEVALVEAPARLRGHEEDRAERAPPRDERHAHRRAHVDLLERAREPLRLLRVPRDRQRRRVGQELRAPGADHLRHADVGVELQRMRLEDRAHRRLPPAAVLDRATHDRPVVLDDVDDAPVAETGHGEPRERAERLVVVERAREHVARLDEEAELVLRLLGGAVQARVVDRERGAAAELLRERHVRPGVPVAGLRPRERERAEHAAARDERDRDRGARVEPRHELEVPVVERRRAQRLGREAREVDGAAARERLPGRLARADDRLVLAVEHVEELLLLRQRRADGDAPHRPVLLGDVDDEPVGEPRNDEVRKRRSVTS